MVIVAIATFALALTQTLAMPVFGSPSRRFLLMTTTLSVTVRAARLSSRSPRSIPALFATGGLRFIAEIVIAFRPRIALNAVVPNLHHAYRHPAFREARYAVFMTGPSATADIEGILVRGAQGIRSLTVVGAPEGLIQVNKARRSSR